jgi:hypothetical protein
MTVSSRALVELVLLGSSDDRRQLLDSPILGDVWIAYALKPTAALDLLITPNKDAPAGPVAMLIAQRLAALNVPRPANQPAEIAPLQNIVAARSPKKQSLAAFFDANKRFAKKIQIVDEKKPHLINLLDEM